MTLQEAHAYIDSLSHDERVLQMKQYIQHGSVTTYDHVLGVARLCVTMNHKMNLGADDRQLVRGAVLHDYYLYDWHGNTEPGLHGFTHPFRAMRNADRDFGLTLKEKNMIFSHMWPLTLLQVPKCREAWILCAADKIVSTEETVMKRNSEGASA